MKRWWERRRRKRRRKRMAVALFAAHASLYAVLGFWEAM
jgi:hypothetical protein